MGSERSIPRLVGLSISVMLYACLGKAQAPSSRNLVPTTRHAPDEFGTQDYTVTTIAAPSFSLSSNGYVYSQGDSIVFFSNPPQCLGSGNLGELWAPVNIPSGAVIDFIGLETSSPVNAMWGANLVLVDRFFNQTTIASLNSTTHGWDSDYNSTALGFQLSRNVHNELVLNAEYAGTDGACGELGWVEIWWKRSVSPPPANPTFNDVPTSDPAFQYIEALAASGITVGCGGGNYCPDAPLTRRQMAVFLSKGFGLHWPY